MMASNICPQPPELPISLCATRHIIVSSIVPERSEISTNEASSLSFRVAPSVSGRMPETFWFSSASTSVRALMLDA